MGNREGPYLAHCVIISNVCTALQVYFDAVLLVKQNKYLLIRVLTDISGSKGGIEYKRVGIL